MINEIINGNAIAIVLMIDGKRVNFNLALFNDQRWGRKEAHYEFGYLENNDLKIPQKLLYFRSPYSGGNTGCGVSNRVQLLEQVKELKFVSFSLEAMNKIAKSEDDQAKKEKKEFETSQREKAKKINKLPRKV